MQRSSHKSEIAQTSIIELRLDEVSAKVRAGDPEDDEEDLQTDVWAGVIPMRVEIGDAVPADDLRDGIHIPDYLRPYRRYT